MPNSSNAPATEQLRQKTADIRQNVSELSDAAKAAAGEKLGEIRDSANQVYAQGREQLCQAEQTVETYIRQQPIKAIAIAAGIGFIAGACFIRR